MNALFTVVKEHKMPKLVNYDSREWKYWRNGLHAQKMLEWDVKLAQSVLVQFRRINQPAAMKAVGLLRQVDKQV